jgi:hypothetical protein
MAKRNRKTTQNSIKRKLRECRGTGRLAEYKPWLHIQDVASKGLVTRIKGWKTGRVHHLLSLLELRYFYVLEWSQDVIDIREQYPLLPLEETLAIAGSCGIRHPADPRTKHPVVMTTDFVNTVRRGPTDFDEARTVKYKDDLNHRRTLEKLEIERRYWDARRIKLKIVTQDHVHSALTKNVEWVHPYLHLEDFSGLPELTLGHTIWALRDALGRQNAPLRDVALRCDDRLGLEVGTSLSVVRHLIAARRLKVDMRRAINPRERLAVLN